MRFVLIMTLSGKYGSGYPNMASPSFVLTDELSEKNGVIATS